MSARRAALTAAAGALVLGCFGPNPVDRLSADGLCASSVAPDFPEFCDSWQGARDAFYRMDWDRAIALAQRADRVRRDYPAVQSLIARAQVASKAGDAGPYNMRLDDCPEVLGLETRNDAFQLLRCPHAKLPRGIELLRVVEAARAALHPALNADEPTALDVAVYVHLCARLLSHPEMPDGRPIVTLGCAWRAASLDLAAVEAEATLLPPVQRGLLRHALQKDQQTLQARADAQYPPGSRDRELFLELPARLQAEHRAFRRRHAGALAAIERIDGELAGGAASSSCAATLRVRLQEHMAGVRGARPAAQEALEREPGILVADALARCYFFTGDLSRAAAWLEWAGRAAAPSTLAEKIYRGQHAALRAQLEQPRRRGRSPPPLATASLEDVPVPALPVPAAFDRWRSATPTLLGQAERVRGVVSRVETVPGGAEIHFAAKRPGRREQCEPSARIARLTRVGRIVHVAECHLTRARGPRVAPPPALVREARGIRSGHYVEVVRPDGQRHGAIVLALERDRPNAKVVRVADLAL